jgi:hypothetical protein
MYKTDLPRCKNNMQLVSEAAAWPNMTVRFGISTAVLMKI